MTDILFEGEPEAEEPEHEFTDIPFQDASDDDFFNTIEVPLDIDDVSNEIIIMCDDWDWVEDPSPMDDGSSSNEDTIVIDTDHKI